MPVTLAAPTGSTFPDGPFATEEVGPLDDLRLADALQRHDIAVVQVLHSPRLLLSAIRHARWLVVDAIAPFAYEAAEGGVPETVVAWRARQLAAHVAAADLLLCTNERQKDLLNGIALGGGRVESDLATVVPHGLDEADPSAGSRPLRRSGAVGPDDRVAIWAGGFWPWLDPLTPLRAAERLHATQPDTRLALIGSDPSDERSREALAYVRDRELDGGAVVLVPGRLSRAEYVDHLRDANAGVTAHPRTMEARYATRTRVLDYLAAGLPVACTRGDAMSEYVEANGFGAVAEPGDVDAFEGALERVLRPGAREAWKDQALEPLRWRNVARPLVEYCLDPPPSRSRRAAALLALRGYPAFASSIAGVEGPGGVLRAARRRVGRG